MKRNLAAVLLLAVLTACGSSDVSTQTITDVSLGQQLIDLKKARDSGALSPGEYDKHRSRIIDNAQ